MFIFFEKNRSFIRAGNASRTPAKTISRTIVLVNPTQSQKNCCVMGSHQLKEVTAGQYRTVYLEKSE
jgi:hypothetical protein